MIYLNSISFPNNAVHRGHSKMNPALLATNSVGDFFLTPARYLLGGKTVTCIHSTDYSGWKIPKHGGGTGYASNNYYAVEERKANFIKMALAIAFVIPSLIIGILIKAPALLSKEMREYYTEFAQIKSNEDKAYHLLRAAFEARNPERLKIFYHQFDQMSDLERSKFFKDHEQAVFIAVQARDITINAEFLRQLRNDQNANRFLAAFKI